MTGYKLHEQATQLKSPFQHVCHSKDDHPKIYLSNSQIQNSESGMSTSRPGDISLTPALECFTMMLGQCLEYIKIVLYTPCTLRAELATMEPQLILQCLLHHRYIIPTPERRRVESRQTTAPIDDKIHVYVQQASDERVPRRGTSMNRMVVAGDIFCIIVSHALKSTSRSDK